MQNRTQTKINSEEWTTVRDFVDTGTGYSMPKYEAKFVEGVEKKYIANEVVVVKETSSMGGERIYQFPKEIFERVAAQLQ